MASWSIGFQAANLGKKIDGYKLPAKLGLGGAIDLPFSMENRLQFFVRDLLILVLFDGSSRDYILDYFVCHLNLSLPFFTVLILLFFR